MTFAEQLKYYAELMEKTLEQKLPSNDCVYSEVVDAMSYSLLGGGKRLRAALLLSFCKACGGREEDALPFACALEMIHAYSLIHDDLPCMDDDDLRRGKPSCHKVYGEAIALLAGDALLTYAFETMLHVKNISASVVLEAAACLSKAAGVNGMIGGQVMDLANEQQTGLSESRIIETNILKTGALISAACEMGCIIAESDENQRKAARYYAEKIGIAFQITDDILDVVSSTEELGKPVGSDEDSQKFTYVSLYGVDEARSISARLLSEAKESLLSAGINDKFLLDMADYILERKY